MTFLQTIMQEVAEKQSFTYYDLQSMRIYHRIDVEEPQLIYDKTFGNLRFIIGNTGSPTERHQIEEEGTKILIYSYHENFEEMRTKYLQLTQQHPLLKKIRLASHLRTHNIRGTHQSQHELPRSQIESGIEVLIAQTDQQA